VPYVEYLPQQAEHIFTCRVGAHASQARHFVEDEREAASVLEPEAPTAHFVSNDGTCYDGAERSLVGAFAFAAAGPYGSLYRGVSPQAGGCKKSGPTRAHSCYPGVTEHFVSKSGPVLSDVSKAAALASFATDHHLELEFVERLASCSCHPESAVGAGMSATLCNVTELGVGSITHVDPTNGTYYELMCNQGPWVHQLAVVATMKSSPLIYLHQYDQLVPAHCDQRGFPAYLGVATPPAPTLPFGDSRVIDHCYPPSTLWAREEINATNADVIRTTQIEGAITGSGNNTYALYDVYAHVLALPELMNNTMECNCLPGSGVFNGSDPGAGPGVPAMCNYTTQPATTHSPIRDWWGGYEGVPLPRAPGSPQRGPIEASLARRAHAAAVRAAQADEAAAALPAHVWQPFRVL